MNNRRSELMKLCGLPELSETSHCFNDNTHQTCCILGPEARKYSELSGNPIGNLAEKMNPGKELTPWCTCAGSQVCSYYQQKFNDGTHIKFVNDDSNKVVYDFESNKNLREKDIILKAGIRKHFTPGVGVL